VNYPFNKALPADLGQKLIVTQTEASPSGEYNTAKIKSFKNFTTYLIILPHQKRNEKMFT
jgi:hypothetical protein